MPTAADTPAYFNLAQSILIFLAFVLAVFIILTCKKIYFRIKYSKRYYIFPKIDIKGIANISMVISIAIAIILLLTVVTGGLMGIVFRVYPGFRVTIEGILIKIGGLIFGPVVGLFIAALTDILSILLTAGMFHYGYFIAALAYGVLSGLVKTSLNMSKNNEVKFAFFSTILLLIFAFVTIGNVELQTGPFGGQMFGMDISIPKYVIMIIDAAAFILAFVTIWTCVIIYNRKDFKNLAFKFKYIFSFEMFRKRNRRILMNKKYDNANSIVNKKFNDKYELKYIFEEKTSFVKAKNNWLLYFIPVLMLVVISESFVDICLLPLSDQQLGGGLPYQWWLAVRSVTLLPVILLNILVIYPVYKVIIKNVKYDYSKNIIESARKQLIEENNL